jgi:DNA repair protein RAD50
LDPTSYIKDRRARELKRCDDRVQELEHTITELSDIVRQRRDAIAVVEKEKNEGGATLARYRDNVRLRKLRAELVQVKRERDSYDMEEASKARRNFERTFPKMQEKLERLKDKVREDLVLAINMSDYARSVLGSEAK